MGTNAILMAAIGGGAGAALGAGLGVLLAGLIPQSVRSAAVLLCALAAAALGAWLAPSIAARVAPPPPPPSTASVLLADPDVGALARAWQARDGAGFAAFAGSNAPTAAPAALMQEARARFIDLDDGDLVSLIRLSRDQMSELAASQPIACHPLFHGRRFGDIAPYLSQEARAREAALMTAALSAQPAAARSRLEGDAFNAAIDRLVARTRSAFGEDIALIAPDAQVEGREVRACQAAAALYDEMQRAPEPEAAALMRGLLALSGG
ncbi:MAG: hypothetical protein AB7G40_16940 [Hyphomonadaceae bacterium]